MDQMDLPQIRRVAEFQDPRQVLDRRPGMRVALDAMPGPQGDPLFVGLAQIMGRAAADRFYHSGHLTTPGPKTLLRLREGGAPSRI